MPSRQCPSCTRAITYRDSPTGRSNFSRAEREGKLCKSCTMKRERVQNAGAWLNKESVRKKSESLKLAHARHDAPWNTPEWRAHQSWVATQQALSGTHPFQNLSREQVMDAAQKSRTTNMMSGSIFQQHMEWRNTDEGHVWLSEIAKKFRAENPVFKSNEYKEKIRAHLTQARKQVKQSRSSKHERLLAELLHTADHRFVLNEAGPKVNIGPYHPDIVDVERKIVVEFYGDYSHSHPDKYVDDAWNALRHRTAREVREFDAKRNAFIESQGWKVIVVWESEWKASRENVIQRIIGSCNETLDHRQLHSRHSGDSV